MKPTINTYQINGHVQFLPFALPEAKRGACEIRHQTEKAGRTLAVVSLRNAIFMGLPVANMTLTRDTIVHQLIEDGQVWMQAIPQEIEQAERQLSEAHGNVLVGGLGLGLAVAILQRNRWVNSITVIEKSHNVIRMVSPFLPRSKAPVKVIKDDLFDALRAMQATKETYDFAFYDIWGPTGQMAWARYVKPLRRLSMGVVPQNCIQCWNEDEMLGQIRMTLHQQCGIIGRKLTGWVSMTGLPQAKFDEMAKSDHRDLMRQDWAFWNWARGLLGYARKPGRDRAKRVATAIQKINNAVPSFMAALKDPDLYDVNWKAWEP